MSSESKSKGVDPNEPGGRGVLQIVVHSATGLRDVQTLGKQDPFLQLHFDGDKISGKEHDNGGKNPRWDQTFHFPVDAKNAQTKLKIRVLDKNITLNTQIGEVEALMSGLLQSPHVAVKREFDVVHEGKNAGKLNATTMWLPPLLVVVHEGKGLMDVQSLGKQDPYCKWTFGGITRTGKEVDNGGKNPNFEGQSFFYNPSFYGKKYKDPIERAAPFHPDNEKSLMNAIFEGEIYDKNVVSDTLIGKVSFTFEQAMQMMKSKDRITYLPLQRDDKKDAGHLGVSIRWH
jgi:hypothetical protein